MIDALIAGRLYGKPAERSDKNGKPFATAEVDNKTGLPVSTKQMEAWVSEIKARAWVRIGEISRDLEDGRGVNQHLPSNGKKLKSETLKAAGISTSAAHRAEKLAAPEAREALEQYIADKAAAGRPVKITEALSAVESNAREQRHRSELHRPADSDLPPGLHVGDFRPRPSLDLLAHQVLTEYHVARKRKAVREADTGLPFGDDLSGAA